MKVTEKTKSSVNLSEIYGKESLNTLNELQNTLNEISSMFEEFPEAIKAIVKEAQNLSDEFLKIAEGIKIDPEIFDSIFWGTLSALSVAWETLINKIDFSQYLKLEIDTEELTTATEIVQDLTADLKTITNLLEDIKNYLADILDAIPAASTPFEDLLSNLANIASVLGFIISLIELLTDKDKQLTIDISEDTLNALQDFPRYLEKITEALEPLNEQMLILKDCIGDIEIYLSYIKEDLKEISETLSLLSETIIENLPLLSETILEAVSILIDGLLAEIDFGLNEVIEIIFEALNSIVDNFVLFFKNLYDSLGEIRSLIRKSLLDDWNEIKKIFSPALNFFTKLFSSVWKSLKETFEPTVTFFNDLNDAIKKIFVALCVGTMEDVTQGLKDALNAVITFVQSIINGCISKVNSVISVINMIPGVSLDYFKTINLPRLELGGLVSPGQLFVARESGPELVGSYGGYAAVMNNNQIVESVSRGVYNAVTNALKQNNQQGGSYTFTIHNELNGREISKQVFKYHNDYVKMQGRSPLII